MWIFNNLAYKGLALLLAIALWAIAQGFQDVERGIDVPVALEQVPDDVVVMSQSASEINVRVTGSRAALRRAERQLARYPISLAGIRPGEAQFAVDIERLDTPRGADIRARSPSTISLTIEERIERLVPVRVDVVGELPEGYKIKRVTSEPTRVRLQGARSVVRRLREVMTDRVDVSALRETTEREVTLVLDSPYVSRAEGDPPIRVRVEVDGPPEPAAPESAGG